MVIEDLPDQKHATGAKAECTCASRGTHMPRPQSLLHCMSQTDRHLSNNNWAFETVAGCTCEAASAGEFVPLGSDIKEAFGWRVAGLSVASESSDLTMVS
jgi:hypothetical protein